MLLWFLPLLLETPHWPQTTVETKLGAVFETQSKTCWVEKDKSFLWCPGCAPVNTFPEVVGCFCSQGTLLAHAQPCVCQGPQVPSWRATPSWAWTSLHPCTRASFLGAIPGVYPQWISTGFWPIHPTCLDVYRWQLWPWVYQPLSPSLLSFTNWMKVLSGHWQRC